MFSKHVVVCIFSLFIIMLVFMFVDFFTIYYSDIYYRCISTSVFEAYFTAFFNPSHESLVWPFLQLKLEGGWRMLSRPINKKNPGTFCWSWFVIIAMKLPDYFNCERVLCVFLVFLVFSGTASCLTLGFLTLLGMRNLLKFESIKVKQIFTSEVTQW